MESGLRVLELLHQIATEEHLEQDDTGRVYVAALRIVELGLYGRHPNDERSGSLSFSRSDAAHHPSGTSSSILISLLEPNGSERWRSRRRM